MLLNLKLIDIDWFVDSTSILKMKATKQEIDFLGRQRERPTELRLIKIQSFMLSTNKQKPPKRIGWQVFLK